MSGQEQTPVYREQGGEALIVESSGKIGPIGGVTITVGAEATNVINVAIQLNKGDKDASALEQIGHVRAYLSDVSTGLGVTTNAPVTSVAIGTDGAIIVEDTAKIAWQLQSEADGSIDLDITETSTDTWYLVVVLANGVQIVSDAITFA